MNQEIERAPLFCADLTSLNHNVMFELGFANVRHGKQLDRLAVVANVFPHLNRQAARS